MITRGSMTRPSSEAPWRSKLATSTTLVALLLLSLLVLSVVIDQGKGKEGLSIDNMETSQTAETSHIAEDAKSTDTEDDKGADPEGDKNVEESSSYREVLERNALCLEEVWAPLNPVIDCTSVVEKAKQGIARCQEAECLILQLKNGRMHMVFKARSQVVRGISTMSLIKASLDRDMLSRLNDFEIGFLIGDDADYMVGQRLPALAYCIPSYIPPQALPKTLYPFPDYGYWGWPDIRVNDVEDLEQELFEVGKARFESRSDKRVLWRGAKASNVPLLRGALGALQALLHKEGLDDINYITYPIENSPYSMTLPEHCKNRRYLLHTEGLQGKWSARLKWLLMCGSVVFIPELSHQEFYTTLLKDGVNCVFVSNDANLAAAKIISFIRDTPLSKQARIAAKGRELGFKYGTRQAAKCYARKFFKALGSCPAQNFKLDPFASFIV